MRERSIGIALFGRTAAWDTADDAIVRLTASDVRKRLVQHYGKIGADSKFRISLPPGSYVPEFSFLAASALSPLDSPPPPIPAGNPRVAETPADTRSHRPLVVTIAVLVLVVAAAFWWTLGRRLGNFTARENLIEAAFRGTPSPERVVVADDGLS